MKRLLLALILLVLSAPVLGRDDKPTTFTAQVRRVVDGDTLDVVTTRTLRVRLHAIDAPETKQPYGPQAKDALTSFTAGRWVVIDQRGRDMYGRIVGQVFSEQGNVNVRMLESGNAWVYVNNRGNKDLMKAEGKARTARIGLWTESNPTPPWLWRKSKKRGFKQ